MMHWPVAWGRLIRPGHGLLFVSISLRPDSVFGGKSAADGRALAGSAFTALVNAFFVSLLALMPRANLGFTAAILAGFSLFRTLQLHWRIGRRDLHLVPLILPGVWWQSGVAEVTDLLAQVFGSWAGGVAGTGQVLVQVGPGDGATHRDVHVRARRFCGSMLAKYCRS
jgi:hypothetical protein